MYALRQTDCRAAGGADCICRGHRNQRGGATGVDGAAQWKALEAGGTSCAIVGSSVEIYYPKKHSGLFQRLEQEGGVISEFPPGTQPIRTHFPMRNRIISGLSDVVVVVEARYGSGSLITAD
ncbi:MAG: DNA-processing protein DprA [Lachnospiraceae bacterium]